MNEINHGERKEKLLDRLKKLFLKFRRMLSGKYGTKMENDAEVSADYVVGQSKPLPRIGPQEASIEHLLDQQDAEMYVERKYGRAAQSAKDEGSYD